MLLRTFYLHTCTVYTHLLWPVVCTYVASISFILSMRILSNTGPPQWRPHHLRAAAAAATFYFEKFRQGLGLGGLASRGGPETGSQERISLRNFRGTFRLSSLWRQTLSLKRTQPKEKQCIPVWNFDSAAHFSRLTKHFFGKRTGMYVATNFE